MMSLSRSFLAIVLCFLVIVVEAKASVATTPSDAPRRFVRTAPEPNLDSNAINRPRRTVETAVIDFEVTETANGTLLLNIEPTITACHCDRQTGDCITNARTNGDSISVCMSSNYLDIDEISSVTLRQDNIVYHPVANGTANSVTLVEVNGTSAVVTTMIVSAFFQNVNTSLLVVEGQVRLLSEQAARRRNLGDSTSRSLALQQNTTYLLVGLCSFLGLVTLAIATGIVMAKCCVCSRVVPDEGSTQIATATKLDESSDRDEEDVKDQYGYC